MIRNVDIDRSPIKPGESRSLRIEGSEPMMVAIACFTNDPPPPGYKPCVACGTLRNVSNGQEVKVTADRQMFVQNTGYVEVTITDEAGDTARIQLTVSTDESAGGTFFASA